MGTLDELRELATYYAHTRGVGHTHAMMHGALNTDNVIILAHDMKYATELVRQCGGPACEGQAIPLSLHSLEHGLRGHRKPLLIDNSAMWWLLQDAIKEIESHRQASALIEALESNLVTKKAHIKSQRGDLGKLTRRIIDLEAKLSKTWGYRLRAWWHGRLNI